MYMMGVTFNCMYFPRALPVMFLKPSTNSHALDPVLPILTVCIFLPLFVIGRGVNILRGPEEKLLKKTVRK